MSIVNCGRCGEPLRTAETNTPEAHLVKKKTTPGDGHCVNCAVAESFSVMELRRLIPDPKVLLEPHVQAQFGLLLKSGKSDAKLEEINWAHVVKHWHLPFKGDKGGRRMPTRAAEQDEEARREAERNPRPARPNLRSIQGGKGGGMLN